MSALIAFAAVAPLAACASSGSAARTSARSDQISSAEIASSSASNAYQLIERLRPSWLRTKIGSIGGGARAQVIVVYLDGIRLGDVGSLRQLSTAGFKSVEWLDATRAATVLPSPGSDPIAGAILIKTQ